MTGCAQSVSYDKTILDGNWHIGSDLISSGPQA
jgi:hypothetical protein